MDRESGELPVKRRYVRREHPAPEPRLPKDRQVGRTFIEANGDHLVAVWTGSGPLPGSHEWPNGTQPHQRKIGIKW
jgi:hypothetical protein